MDALRALLANPKTPAATRLNAITLVLNAAMAEVDPAHLHPSVEAAIHQNSSLSTEDDQATPGGQPVSASPNPVPQHSSQLEQFLSEMEESATALGERAPENTPGIHRNSSQSPAFPYRAARKPGRNEPCPCGSGQKYKRCCVGS